MTLALPPVGDEQGELRVGAAGTFVQPDIDADNLKATATPQLSDSSDLLLRVRWLAALAGRVNTCLACSGGVHTPSDAVKAVMAGADAVQVVSALLAHGPEYLATLREGMERWLEERDYETLRQAYRSMSLLRCPDPQAFERGNYMRILQNWKPSDAGAGVTA